MNKTKITIKQSPTTGYFEVYLDDKLVACFDQFKGADKLADELREQYGLSYRSVRNMVSEGA